MEFELTKNKTILSTKRSSKFMWSFRYHGVLAAHTENPDISVGKPYDTHHSIWKVLEILCNRPESCTLITLFGHFLCYSTSVRIKQIVPYLTWKFQPNGLWKSPEPIIIRKNLSTLARSSQKLDRLSILQHHRCLPVSQLLPVYPNAQTQW